MPEAKARLGAATAVEGPQGLLDAIQDVCIFLDPTWRITYLNATGEAFFGRSRAELLGRNLLEEFPNLVGSAGQKRIDQAFEDGQRARFEAISAVTGAPVELDIHPHPHGVAVFARDVRARWALEEQLRERDARLRLAEESGGVGIWEIDVASDTVRGTEQYFRIMGLEPTTDPVPMQVLRDLRLDADRDRVNRQYSQAVKADTDVCDTEFRIRWPDGRVRWVFGRGRIVRDGAGAAVRYSGVDIDITDRKAAEDALAESEDRLRMAIMAADLGIWDWNVSTDEMTWSERAKEIAGFPADRPVSFEQVRAATHPEDLPRTSEMARRALNPLVRSREPYEYRLVRSDGTVRWVLAHGEARFAEIDGVEKAVRYTGTIQDITARKDSDAKLHESEARLRLAVEAARQAVWEYDVASGQLHGSPELNRLLGFPEGQQLDMDEIRRRYLPGEQERLRAAAAKALSEGERFFETEYRYAGPEGQTRWLLLRAELLLASPGNASGVRGVLMDVTEKKAAEEHRELMLAELQHRVRNTLTLVAAIANQTFTTEPEAARKAFSARLAALGRAHDILTRERWQFADCRQVVDFALAPYRANVGRFSIEGPDFRLDSRQAVTLALCINELATNAAKYGALSVSGGRIAITWAIEAGPDGDMFVFRWAESDGPAVVPPARAGFGTRLIQQSLAADFNGHVELEYLSEGVACTLRAPWPGALDQPGESGT